MKEKFIDDHDHCKGHDQNVFPYRDLLHQGLALVSHDHCRDHYQIVWTYQHCQRAHP